MCRIIVLTNYCQGNVQVLIHVKSDNCTKMHAKKIHGGRHTESKRTNRHAGRQRQDTTVIWQQAKRQKCVQADMKTLMLTKCRQTAEMDDKYRCACRQINRQTVMWVGRTIDRQTSRQA